MNSDEGLMIEVRNGSRAAFETLFERYREPVWRFFRRRTADAGRAEELAQDTFVAILQGARRYEPRGPFRSFLFGTAYNVLQADRRKAAFRATQPLDTDPSFDEADPASGIWVRQAMATLNDGDREVLMLRFFEEMDYEEIARVTSSAVGTVRSRIHYAKRALRNAFDQKTYEHKTT